MDMYNVLTLLDRGTFGTIYLCERKHNQQKLVIKEIKSDVSGECFAAAKNEVKVLKSLNHPNIIKYHDSFDKTDILYIVMEYASGGTLQKHIANNKPKRFAPQKVIDLFAQILSGLHHIHSRKVIHRDLKCENIFLSGLENDVVKIGDFGISKILLKNNDAQTVVGTCNYLAPELCNGKAYDTKSDIWALGCILYELCALEKMFEGTLANIVLSITAGRRKSIDTRFYGFQLEEIIHSMLQQEPSARPDTLKLMSHPDIFPSLQVLGTTLGCISKNHPFEF